MRFTRAVTAILAAVALVFTGIAVATPAQAADKRKCVTTGEYNALKVGMTKAKVKRLLDGKGKKSSSKTRRYVKCATGEKVYVKFNKKYTKKSAKVREVWTKTVAAPAPAPAPPVVVAPPVPANPAPVTPPVIKDPVPDPTEPTQPPVIPDPKPEPPPVDPDAGKPDIDLNDLGSRYTGQPIPIVVYISGDGLDGTDMSIYLEHEINGVWTEVSHIHGVTETGRYQLPNYKIFEPMTAKFRTKLWRGEELLATSDVIEVVILEAPPVDPTDPPVDPEDPPVDLTNPDVQPTPVTEERMVKTDVKCEVLSVNVSHQMRTNTWTWDATQSLWVANWSMWMTHHQETRDATAADCVNVVDSLASDALLPDIQIKSLNKCGKGDLDLTGGDCFMIVNPAPFEHDFPALEGKKLLKFPVLTMNVGDGPAEIIADRSSSNEANWKAYQNFTLPSGERQSVEIPKVEFYFAGDGHNHWHFTDFDNYWIEKLDGTKVGTAEKHGYCVYDNTSYTPFIGKPSVPGEAVYGYDTTCAQGLPSALTMIQGLSKGWGDTYPATLPDQALDITGLPDGRYRVGVTADDLGAIRETNENNNTTTIEVTITGDDVTVHADTAAGGLE